MAFIPCRDSAIAAGTIAAGAGGNFSWGLRSPFVRKGWRTLAKMEGPKNFIHPLETKFRFFYFSIAIARWLRGA
jgi:hypothetical protein